MPNCLHISRLEAYHDGELSPDASREIEQHLPDCAECSREMERIRELSALLVPARAKDITPLEMARLHQAIDKVDDRSLVRFAVGISGIAASILIISAAWLHDAPRPVHGNGPTARTEQTWEHLASTGNVEKLPQGVPQTGVAEQRDATNWMVSSTGGRGSHGNP
jgi:anti-sigma factor RsiW